MPRRFLALLIALLLALALAPGAAAAPRPAGSNPPGTVRITSSTGGVARDEEFVGAGTSSALVYVQSLPVAQGVDGDEIFVRTSSGSTTDLGQEPNDPDEAEFSMVGTSLIYTNRDPVYWWNTATRAHGTITPPSDAQALTASPDGFVYEQGGTAYDEDVPTGSSTSLGSLFGGAFFDAVGDSSGLLATSGTAAKYLTWATPSQVSDVDTGGLPLYCDAVEGDYAACVTNDSSRVSELLKLDGGGPVSMPGVSAAFGSVALAGSTIVAVHDSHLYSRSYTSSTIAVSSAKYEYYVASAFGRAVVTTSDGLDVQTVTSATATPRTLFTAPYGPVEAAAFDLSPGQIVDLDNRRNAAHPPAGQTMIRTPLTTDAATLEAGGVSTVATGVNKNTSPLASGTTTAVPDTTESLTLTGPHRSHTIVKVNLGGTPQLSGNRLVYYSQDAARPGFYLYDLAKNTTSLVLALDIAKTNDYLPVPAISGNDLAIMHTNGEVTQRNIDTGASTVVSAPDPSFDINGGGSVWERGDWIGWSRAEFVDKDGDYNDFGGYRDVATSAAPVTDNVIDGLAATGVIEHLLSGNFALRLFDGGTLHLPPSETSYYEGTDAPQVEGRTVAWVTDTQELFAAPLHISPAPPRMEGDTLAPKPALSNIKWHPYVPYSEPLTSCSATVTSGTRTVATLPCNKAYLATGVADLVWDGMTGSHHDPAGTYHYTITAAGDGGAALDSAGTSAPVAGHFTID